MFEHEAEGWVFKHLPRDPANVNTLKTLVDRYSCINLMQFFFYRGILTFKMQENVMQIYGIQCRFGQLITFERTAARECFVYAVSGHCQSEKCS